MEASSNTLTIEQQFQINNMRLTMAKASPEQTAEMLLFIYTEMLKQKNGYCEIIKNLMGV